MEMLKVNFHRLFTNYYKEPHLSASAQSGKSAASYLSSQLPKFRRLWASRLPAVRERPSAIRPARGAYGARGVASALSELNPLL